MKAPSRRKYAIELIGALFVECERRNERIDAEEAKAVAALRAEASAQRDHVSRDVKHLQCLKRVFEQANLMGHDDERMYDFVAEKFGVPDGDADDRTGVQGSG
jgi:hypothetical protein